ncbi:lysozyme [Lelliottia amnigena]|uniref:lysozyme n=1 Tax=Lelliottia amnigena TaxID=61646 RepID=UPI0037C11072
MKTSNNGIGFIRAHEGCKLNAYLDGGGAWTIGVGNAKGVKKGQTITQEEADQFLADVPEGRFVSQEESETLLDSF